MTDLGSAGLNTIVRHLLLLLCAWSAAVFATDDEPIYGGCVDAAGAGVISLIDTQLPAVVATSTEAGRAVIRHNPQALPRLLGATRSFLYAQACARLNLGFAADGVLTAEQARRADCAALATLRRSGLLGDTSLDALEADLSLSEAEWAEVPGPRRPFALRACPATRGALRLPAGDAVESLAWNACVRACAAPLYQCQARCAAGGCADCEAAYARCNRACDTR